MKQHHAIRWFGIFLTLAFITLVAGCGSAVEGASESKIPKIISQFPANGATDIDVDGLTVTVRFDTPMNQASVQGAFSLNGGGETIPGTFSYDGASNTLKFAIGKSLKYGTTYTVKVQASATDANGVAIGSTISWTFKTKALPPVVSLPAAITNPIATNLNTIFAKNGDGLAVWQINSGTGIKLMHAFYNKASDTWAADSVLAAQLANTTDMSFKLAASNNGYMVIWRALQKNIEHVFARVYEQGAWSQPMQLDSKGSGVDSLAVAANSDSYMVIWHQDDEKGIGRIWAKVHVNNGWGQTEAIDNPNSETDVLSAYSPKITVGNNSFGVTWYQTRKTIPGDSNPNDRFNVFARIFQNSQWTAYQQLSINPSSAYGNVGGPSIAALGDKYAVTWSQYTSGAVRYFAFARIFDGTKWDANTPNSAITPNDSWINDAKSVVRFGPVVVANNNAFALVWKQGGPAGSLDKDQEKQGNLFARLHDGSKWLDARQVKVDTWAGEPTDKIVDISVAANTSSFGISWLQEKTGAASTLHASVYGLGEWFVPNDKAALDGDDKDKATPQILSNGTSFTVVYRKKEITTPGGANNFNTKAIAHSNAAVWIEAIRVDDNELDDMQYGAAMSGDTILVSRLRAASNDINSQIVASQVRLSSVGATQILNTSGDTGGALMPKIRSNAAGHVMVVWGQHHNNKLRLYTSVSKDLGASWSDAKLLSENVRAWNVNNPLPNTLNATWNIVSDGDEFMIAWFEFTSNGLYDINAVVYSDVDWSDVTTLASEQSFALNDGSASIEAVPSLSSDKNSMLFTWISRPKDETALNVYRSLYENSTFGTVVKLDSETTMNDKSRDLHSVAGVDGYTVAWIRELDTGVELKAYRYDGRIWSGPTKLNSDTTTYIKSLDASASDTAYAVSWIEDDAAYASINTDTGWSRIWLSADVEKMGDSRFYMSDATIASDGEGFMVVWKGDDTMQNYRVYARQFDGREWLASVTELYASDNFILNDRMRLTSNDLGYVAGWLHSQKNQDAADLYDYVISASQFDGSEWSSQSVLVSQDTFINGRNMQVYPDGEDYFFAWIHRTAIDDFSESTLYLNELVGGTWSGPQVVTSGGGDIINFSASKMKDNTHGIVWVQSAKDADPVAHKIWFQLKP